MLLQMRDKVTSVGDTNKEAIMSHSEKIELWRSEAEAISDPKHKGAHKGAGHIFITPFCRSGR